MRAPHTCNSQASNFLIDLRRHAGSTVECRCITIHPSRPELIAVGVNDPFIRIYDRRMIKVSSVQVSDVLLYSYKLDLEIFVAFLAKYLVVLRI